MPGIKDSLQVQSQEQAKARPQQEAIKQGAEALLEFVGNQMKSLLNHLAGKPGVDDRTIDPAGPRVEAARDALLRALHGLEGTAPGPGDTKLAKDLDDALSGQASLGQVRQEIYLSREEVRQTMQQPFKQGVSEEEMAQQVTDYLAAKERRPWLDQVSEVVRAADMLFNVSDQVNAIQDLAQKGAANEAARALAQMADQLDSYAAQRAFASPLSETPALENTWIRALESVDLERNPEKAWDRVRKQFWRRVNQGVDEDARAVAAIIKAAGYQLGHGSKAPRFRMQWDLSPAELSGRDGDPRHLQNINAAQRLLSIDHRDPQALNPTEKFDSANLRFMPAWDNSVRGVRFTAMDERPTDNDALVNEWRQSQPDHEDKE